MIFSERSGYLKLLDNWRGIMLIESPAKVISSVIANRLSANILEHEGLEEQNGFMRNRGCCDGIFSLKLALQKRHEHGLGTWAAFIDQVKAFDSVPREGLYEVLKKFGIPPKLIRLIVRLHSDLIVKVQVGLADVKIDSITGVKQGCTMAPILFILYLQAIIEVLEAESSFHALIFKTAQDFVCAGRSTNPRNVPSQEEFSLTKLLYADDEANLFNSRDSLLSESGLQTIVAVFK